MRLGQLARKLSLRPAQIIEFLSQQNILIEDNSNTRMEDSHVVLVVRQFAPESLDIIVEEADEVIDEIIPQENVSEENSQQLEDEHVSQGQNEETSQVEEPEVIRVPKIELSGLKVLGKIELPEAKKKEPAPNQADNQADNLSAPSVEEESTAQQIPKVRKPKSKYTSAKRTRSNDAEWRNPLEQQREREAREAQEKKRMEAERLKEKRKKHYQEKVKVTVQPKRAKSDKDESEIQAKPIHTHQPTTWIGKFLKWLNT